MYFKNFVSTLFALSLILGLGLTLSSKKLYQQSCTSSEDCNQEQGLSCQNNICKCDAGGATVYSLAKNRCVGAGGRECVVFGNQSYCVQNAVCIDYGYMHLCSCIENNYQSKDGNCYKISNYQESCMEEDFSCGDTISSSISCINKKCRCVLGDDHQYYDAKQKRCISNAGAQCIPNYYNSCTPNSQCGEVNENIEGASFLIAHKCLCTQGFSYTRDKRCLGAFGTNCDVNNPCNYDEFLGCLNGKCQCKNPLNEVYNERTHQCSIFVNSVCRMDDDDSQKCVDNAQCVSENNKILNTNVTTSNIKPTSFGKCQCAAGYSATPLNTCLLDINQKCQPNQCNRFNALTCINGTCTCIDSFLSYDKSTKSCVSLVSSPCGTVSLFAEDKEHEIVVLCEANAVCSKISASYNGAAKRVCKPGKH